MGTIGEIIEKPNPDDRVDLETGIIRPTKVETRGEQHRFGEPPRLIRNIVCTAATANELKSLVDGIGIKSGSGHPSFPDAKCIEVEYDEEFQDGRAGEQDVYTATLKATYEVDLKEEGPLDRPDVWSFQTQGSAIAALFYIDNNDVMRPMVNSAYDPIKGLQVDEALQKIVIKGNRAVFPSALAAALTNCVNFDSFLGFPPDHVKCQGISGELKFEVVDNVTVRYWEVTVELMARQTGWNLLIPDVGYNYIANGRKERCWVWVPNPDPETNALIEFVKAPSSDPVGLNGNGAMSPTGVPAILTRRVYRRASFSDYFGSPPE